MDRPIQAVSGHPGNFVYPGRDRLPGSGYYPPASVVVEVALRTAHKDTRRALSLVVAGGGGPIFNQKSLNGFLLSVVPIPPP